MFTRQKVKYTRPATRTVYAPLSGDETKLGDYLYAWIKNGGRVRSWDDQEKVVKNAMAELNIDDKYFESLFTFASGYIGTPFYFEYDTAVHPDGSVYKNGGIVKTIWNFLNQKITF